MRIISIDFQNHYLFGDCSLDFSDSAGLPIDTIILAGENGCGKTTLLEMIYLCSLLNFNNKHTISQSKVLYHLLLNDKEKRLISSVGDFQSDFDLWTGELVLIEDYSLISPKNSVFYKYAVRSNSDAELSYRDVIYPTNITNNQEVKMAFRTVYSTVEINYVPGSIISVTNKDIDRVSNESTRNGRDLATEIKQLFIDIHALDAADLQDWVTTHPGEVVPVDIVNKRMNRFSNAFSRIFTNLKYKKISTTPNGKDVIFEKDNVEISISDLSSGEKQIVFRGAFFLSNQKNNFNHIILIDEPEISLHPAWQKRILQFYKDLFHENGEQLSQIIVATHSPFIIHNRERFNDKVFVLKRNGCTVEVNDSPLFPAYGEDTIIEDAYNIKSFKRATVFVEGVTDEKYLTKYLELSSQKDLFDIRWIGYNAQSNSAENTGCSGLNSFLRFAKGKLDWFNVPIILLYDSDTNKEAYDVAQIHTRSLPYKNTNSLFEIGIENLLTIGNDFPKDEFYTRDEKKDKYGGCTTVSKLDKIKLCEYICCDNKRASAYLQNLAEIIELLKQCIAK